LSDGSDLRAWQDLPDKDVKRSPNNFGAAERKSNLWPDEELLQ